MIKNGIKISKSQSRGDEVGFFFLLLVIFFLLIVSLIRFSIIGKVLDDFLFAFLFGWIKYIVYFLSFIVIISLIFSYRIKLQWRYILYIFCFFIVSCWTTQTLSLIVLAKNNLWTSYHNLNLLTISKQYFVNWWNNSAVNDYHGFFASPIIFNNFTVATFFPQYATGGMISNILVGIFNYGFFVTNLIFNFISIVSLLFLFIFNKPFIFCSKFKQIINSKDKKQKNISSHDLKQKHLQLKKEKLLIDKQVKKMFKTNNNNKMSKIKPISSPIKNPQLKPEKTITNSSTVSNPSASPSNYFNENSYLTPFGKIDPEKQKDVISTSKGTLVVKKSLEDSILNREIIKENETIINNESQLDNNK